MKVLKSIYTNKWVRISVLIAVLGVAIFGAVRYYLSYREQSKNALDFLPSNVFSLVQVNNMFDFQELIVKNDIWLDFEVLFSANDIRKRFLLIDSLVSEKKEIYDIWYANQLYISSHFIKEGVFETILLKQLPHPSYEKTVLDFFNSHAFRFDETETINGKTKLFQIALDSTQMNLYLSVKDGVVLMSVSKQLISNAIAASEMKNPIYDDESFMQLMETCGKSSPANMFINNQFLYRYAISVLSEDILQDIHFLNYFAQWSTFDINISKEKISFNGFTATNRDKTQWLDIFERSSRQKTTLVDNVPVGVSSFLWFGFDNYMQFRDNLSAMSQRTGKLNFDDMLQSLEHRTGVRNLKDLIFPYIDNQLLLFSLPRKQFSDKSDNFGLIRITNERQVEQNLIEISKLAAQKARTTLDTSSYRGYKIIRVPADYFFFDLFGNIFRHIDQTYVTIYQNSIVVGASKQGVTDYLNTMIAGRNITKNPFYLEFSKQLSSDANIFLYCSPRALQKRIPALLDERYSEMIEENVQELQNIESVGVQFSQSGRFFLSNISIYRNTEIYDVVEEGWEIKIEAPIAAGPWFVKGIDEQAPNIVMFDAFNQMYLLTDKGDVLWKLPIPEKPISRVFSVDTYKNGKFQYVFNSENNMFLIDRFGRHVASYPIKLPQKAATPINVFDYEKSREYRLVFAGIDNIIYNFNIKGETPKGWENTKISSALNDSIRHIVVANTDVIIMKYGNKNLYGISRRGQKLFELKDIELNDYSMLYVGPPQCKCILTTTKDGQIVEIGLDGKYTLKTIGAFSSGHVFLYQDITGDKNSEYIFIDKGKLTALNNLGEQILELDIANDVGRKAYYIEQTPYGPLLLVFASDGKKYYLINKDGLIANQENQLSENMADFYYIKKSNKLYIISASENTLVFNVIQKD